MDGGWLENEFLEKTLNPKFGLESQFGTSDLEFVNTSKTEGESLYDCVKKLFFLKSDNIPRKVL